jgi:hypothetical protein
MNLIYGSIGCALKSCQTPDFIRGGDVNQVVGNAGLLGGGGLGCADIHSPVEKAGIGGNYLAVKSPGKPDGGLGFADGGRADDYD